MTPVMKLTKGHNFHASNILSEFACTKCDQIFDSEHILNHHKKKEHTEQFICVECNKECNNATKLKNHIKHAHTDAKEKKYFCSLCDLHFCKERIFIAHEKSHLEVKKEYHCPRCGIDFESIYDFRIHNYTKHNFSHAKKKLTCSDCGEIFLMSRGLTQHKRKVHGKNFSKHYRKRKSKIARASTVLNMYQDDNAEDQQMIIKFEKDSPTDQMGDSSESFLSRPIKAEAEIENIDTYISQQPMKIEPDLDRTETSDKSLLPIKMETELTNSSTSEISILPIKIEPESKKTELNDISLQPIKIEPGLETNKTSGNVFDRLEQANSVFDELAINFD